MNKYNFKPGPVKLDLNQQYQDNERKYKYNFDEIIRKYMMKTFKQYLDSNLIGRRIAECGSFDGYSTQILVDSIEHLSHLDVIEGSSELAEKVKERFKENKKVNVVNSLFQDWRPHRHYDSIFIIHTLEHLAEPVKELKHISKWLTKYGRIFIAVPNAKAASRQIAVKMGVVDHPKAVTEPEAKHGHFRTYDRIDLNDHCEMAGLKIIKSGGVLFKPLSNAQFDNILEAKLLDDKYLDACYKLGEDLPDLCASIYTVCERSDKYE